MKTNLSFGYISDKLKLPATVILFMSVGDSYEKAIAKEENIRLSAFLDEYKIDDSLSKSIKARILQNSLK